MWIEIYYSSKFFIITFSMSQSKNYVGTNKKTKGWSGQVLLISKFKNNNNNKSDKNCIGSNKKSFVRCSSL